MQNFFSLLHIPTLRIFRISLIFLCKFLLYSTICCDLIFRSDYLSLNRFLLTEVLMNDYIRSRLWNFLHVLKAKTFNNVFRKYFYPISVICIMNVTHAIIYIYTYIFVRIIVVSFFKCHTLYHM